jgi:hypothetical protein
LPIQSESASQICISLDVDWAPDEIIKPVVEAMQHHGVKATFFATNASELLSGLDEDQFEVGLHPNFNNANGDFRPPLETLKRSYPKAKGARSHSLFVSSHILELYIENGLKYESNIFLSGHHDLHPVIRFEEFLSIPFYWSDDKHISLRTPFELDQLALEMPGIKVLNFHPMHVFMNTSSDEHYQQYKRHYQEPGNLQEFINRERPGIGTLFTSVLEYLETTKHPTTTLYELYQQYSARAASQTL